MINVLVEGSATPCVHLPRGERRVFALTPSVARKIRQGYFIEIERWKIVEDASTGAASVIEEAPTAEDSDDPEFTAGDAPPAESAAKSYWAAWLNFWGVEYPSNATKAEMIEAWKSHDPESEEDDGS